MHSTKERRFAFGRNWSNYISTVTEREISEATAALQKFLGLNSLEGKTFLDIGSGSGIVSLAARRLGAKVRSFDFDAESVATTKLLKTQFYNEDGDWTVEQGSILDREYVSNLGAYDVVYSWGVLHHTGAMHQAFENVVGLVRERGYLFIAIYNDQGWISKYWKKVKQLFNQGRVSKLFVTLFHLPYLFLGRIANRAVKKETKPERGMSLWYDMIDWLGGYPFEVAKPEVILSEFIGKGFSLINLKTCAGRHGCNEYLFRRITE